MNAKSNVSTIIKASEINPEVVTRAANAKGAKQGKDKVAAGRDYTKFLSEQVQHCREAAIGMAKAQGTFVQALIAVGKEMEHSPEVGATFIGMLHAEYIRICFEQADMGDTVNKLDAQQWGALMAKTESWPEVPKAIWQQHLSKRFSDAKRVIAAFTKAHTETMKVLTGPGTHMTKLTMLPKTDARGRKKGSANEQKGTAPDVDGTKSTDQQEKDAGAPSAKVQETQKQMAQNVLSLVANLPVSACLDVLQAFVVKFRAAKTTDAASKAKLVQLADAIQSAVGTFTAAVEQSEEQASAEPPKARKRVKVQRAA